MKLNAKEYMLACLFHPQRESRILLHLNKLCSLAAVHVRLGLPPVRAMRSWRDGNQGFVRGSRRVLGSCKQEKRPGRLQREKSGCPKKEKGKRPCQGKKKRKAQKLITKAMWERGRGETRRSSVEEAQTPRLRKTQRGQITQGPVHILQHTVEQVWDLATEPCAPRQPGPYWIVPKGEHPLHLLRIFSLNLTDLPINGVKFSPAKGHPPPSF